MQKTLKELAQIVDGEVLGDPGILVHGIAGIDEAVDGDITFLANPKYLKRIGHTKASVIICSPDISIRSKTLLRTANPYLSYAKIARILNPPLKEPETIDPRAVIGNNVQLGKHVTIYPFVYIGNGCRIADGVTIYPHCFIGNDASIGEGTLIHANATIGDRCIVGRRVIIHAGTVVGSDGFGFAKDGSRYYKIPQVGIVQIDDDVELGAGNCIDRAAMGKTWIKRGVKTDNLVHIAHNVTVGEDTVLVAQVGISGSVKIGSRVTLAGQVGVAGHITIGDDAMAGGKTGIAGNIAPGQIVSGYPHMPHRDWLKSSRCIPKLPQMRKTIREMEERIHQLEAALKDLQGGDLK